MNLKRENYFYRLIFGDIVAFIFGFANFYSTPSHVFLFIIYTIVIVSIQSHFIEKICDWHIRPMGLSRELSMTNVIPI